MPKILPMLKKQISNITINIVEEKTEILVEMLSQGQIDFALLAATPTENQQFTRKKLFNDKLYVAVAKTNKLANSKKLDMKEIIKHNIMLLDEGNCLYNQTFKICSLVSYNNNSFKGSSLETLRQMVSIDEGITLVPEIACTKTDNVKYIELDGPNFYREIDLVIRKSSVYSKLFEQIAEVISDNHK